MTLPARHVMVALALGAALTASGCGATRASTAAVVDGTVISQDDVTVAMEQVNALEPALLQADLTPSSTLTAMIQAPVILGYLADRGLVASDTLATREAQTRGVEEPAESTVEVIRLAQAIGEAQQTGQLTQQDAVELTEQLRARDVEVNPRYGTFNAETASVELGLPGWLSLDSSAP